MIEEKKMESYFERFRKNIVGQNATFESAYGLKKIVYADWIASGRLYGPIEDKLLNEIGPMVGNTHSEASQTGMLMTRAYHAAHAIIKKHVNACKDDVIITTGFGMTSVLAKFQRILGLKIPERLSCYCNIPDEERPVVFITHIEHHSNHTPWIESLVDLVVLEPDENLKVDPKTLEKALQQYGDRKLKIGSFSACSNVTGIGTPYHELAAVMHKYGGYCFIDFAASAPYADINMHPQNEDERLDAIFFSPHKFLGGPGSSGVLIFNKNLYHNRIPDHPGGGTVQWTNPWGQHSYIADIEIREDGGTPGFLQAMKAALAIKLKEEMGTHNIQQREKEIVKLVFSEFEKIPGLNILAHETKDRLPVFSFYIDGVHHNLAVKLLNDRFGIQVRGGCSCAGTYGHYLLQVDQETSGEITSRIDQGDLSLKPGWVRASFHPTTTDEEIKFISSALKALVENVEEWMKDYEYDRHTNEFRHKTPDSAQDVVLNWLTV